MIQKEDIISLANLARLEVKEAELAGFQTDLDNILAYVSELKNAGVFEGELKEMILSQNVMRADMPTNDTGANQEALLANAPIVKNNFIVVKKILN